MSDGYLANGKTILCRAADAERAAANARRAEEAEIAAFLAKFDGAGDAPALPEPGEDGKTVVDLEMTSVSLLTPGTGRHLFKKGSSVDERRMLTDQTAAWEAVERNGSPIPEPGAPLAKEQQSLLRSIALEGGNFEIQKMNTGIAGFKTGRVDSVAERLGGQEYREFHRGGADHVSV